MFSKINFFCKRLVLSSHLLFILCHSSCTAQTTYDRDSLRELAQFPQQHRFSDGRLCASLFAQNDRVYTNCTTTTSPDGQTGREWCFLADQLRIKNEKNWGYCSPPIDYNFIRAKANEAFAIKVNEVSKMITLLDSERARLEDVEKRYNLTCGHRRDITEIRLHRIEELLSKAERSLVQIRSTREKTFYIQNSIKQLEDQLLHLKSLSPGPQNCGSVQGYEEEPLGDGLKAEYFKNVFFKGVPVTQVDENIDFEWNARDPAPGVPYDGFSIRWSGSLEGPYTGEYIFSTVADCGARVFLNNKPIIVDRMPYPKTLEGVPPEEIELEPPSEQDGPRKVSSLPIMLNAGEKQHLRVEMLHSNHLRWLHMDDSSIKLMWSTSYFKETVIPKKYLYQRNPISLMKISGLNPDNYQLSFLYDGEYMYKDSTTHYLADVPLMFYGLKMIRGLQNPTDTALTFEITSAATMFLGAPKRSGSPLLAPCEGTFRITEDVFSVYEATSRASRATSVKHFSVYQHDLPSAGIFKFDILQNGIPFLIFFKPRKVSHGSCGGTTILLSDPTNTKIFSSCEASSTASSEFNCEYGFGEMQADQPFGTWRTAGGNGVGEFLIIRFKKQVQLSKFRFIPRTDPITWPSEITLSFAEKLNDNVGKTKVLTVSHAANMDALNYPLNSIVTNFVRIEVSRMYVNGEDTGGSFEIWGTECEEEPELEETQTPSLQKSLTTSYSHEPTKQSTSFIQSIDECSKTLENIFLDQPIHVGTSLHFQCPASCFNKTLENSGTFILSELKIKKKHESKENLLSFNSNRASHVFGSSIYAPESSLCFAAAHMGLCQMENQLSKSGRCPLTVTVVPYKTSFPGEVRNNIKSEPHGPAEFGLALTLYKAEEIQGHNVTSEAAESYAIAFQSSNMVAPPQGYLIDDGHRLDVSKKNTSHIIYGWDRPTQVTYCEQQLDEHQNPLNIGGIEFPPDPDSPACEASMSDCEPNSWSIILPRNGLYHIEVQVGNPCHPIAGIRRYYLKANNATLVDGEELPRGRFFWSTAEIPVINHILTLTAECDVPEDSKKELCTSAVTTLMSLKISTVQTSHA
ncbi:uncharacterized protein LOC128883794 [Hylaeus volcanicus]|uniref:uncharacterized protein LOC128883794 n=1 Tax=Hylaeus volcanicus TaxID=313075 RepID=UPI0023B778DE|nr:uncharacterized protein LOC128883794 [Hylaeus volcanicus]